MQIFFFFRFMEGLISSPNFFSSAFASAFKISLVDSFNFEVVYSAQNRELFVVDTCDIALIVISYITTSNEYFYFSSSFPIYFLIPYNSSFTVKCYASFAISIGGQQTPTLACEMDFSASTLDFDFSTSTSGVTFGGNFFLLNRV